MTEIKTLPDTRPNILWITTDQQRFDTIGALGNPHIHTPNLDRLCADGVAFTQTYCQNPICTPSRASFLTGLYPSTIHAGINGNAEFSSNERVQLITRRLARTGYRCGLVGKLHIASAWNGVEVRSDDGYREFHYSHSPHQGHGNGNAYMEWVAAQGVFDQVFQEVPLAPGQRPGGLDTKRYAYREDIPPQYHQSSWCVDRAIDFVQAAQGTPWLMSVNIFDPHPPFDAPKSYADRYDASTLPPPLFRAGDMETQRRLGSHCFQQVSGAPGPRQQAEKANYYGMIELIDENVGRLMRALDASGQRQSTVVIFMSDHGEMLGDHGLTQKGCRFYEGLVRVPLILSWPERFQTGLQCATLTELTDLAPTLAELAGLDSIWSHGRSLLPILTGDTPDFQPHEYVRCEFYDTLDMHAPDGDLAKHVPSYATMYRDVRHKLVVYHGNDYGELYDLQTDPHEFENLWERPEAQAVRNRLLRQSFDASITIADPGSRRIGRY